jgi:hypothetical protein
MASAFPPDLSGGLSAKADPHPKPASHRGDDARAQELHHLRLALATFALQLDAFEARTRRLKVGKALAIPALRTHNGQDTRKEEVDWASIKSAGSRSDT